MARSSKIKAVILAGGKGTRLKPYTHIFPKPLMPIGNRPILDIVLSQLASAGVDEAIVTVGHESAKFMKMVTAAGSFDLKISYSIETKPLGTAGPLKLIKSLGSDFFVLNGDILTDLDFKKFMRFHKKNNRLATIASFEREQTIDFGVIESDGDIVSDYIEKPTDKYLVSMGIYAFKREILTYIPVNRRYDFPTLVKKLIRENRPPAVYRHHGQWLDIGREDDYRRASELFFESSGRFLKAGNKSFSRRRR